MPILNPPQGRGYSFADTFFLPVVYAGSITTAVP
jgi:hypothetical protein